MDRVKKKYVVVSSAPVVLVKTYHNLDKYRATVGIGFS